MTINNITSFYIFLVSCILAIIKLVLYLVITLVGYNNMLFFALIYFVYSIILLFLFPFQNKMFYQRYY